MSQTTLQAYLASLPEVETSRLLVGTLFTAHGLLYQVIEAGATGFRKARQWRQDEDSDVALVPDSYLANFLPVVARGRLLPIYPTRQDLLDKRESTCYLFIDEQVALDAAYLDNALVKGGGTYVRNHGLEPAFAITDGIHVFRLYYYDRSGAGKSALTSAAAGRTLQFRFFYRGPMYWRLLPSWPRSAPFSDGDETLPHTPPVKF